MPSLAKTRPCSDDGSYLRNVIATDTPNRQLDRWNALAAEWAGGCLVCGRVETGRPLPGSDGELMLPLCERHVRWAMASRRERMGKQAGNLKKLLLAWSRHRESPDHERRARAWLGF